MTKSNHLNTATLPSDRQVQQIEDFIKEGIDLQSGRLDVQSDPFWKGLTELGSELWLDTGDMEEAGNLWTSEFSALTTNNTLLNKEVQKGIYDELIQKAAGILSDVDEQTRVIEIAFILNARHALRLVQRFGGKVSVELHTDLAHDIEGSIRYARRYYKICPEHFIIKVPLTPSGLIATRRLREERMPVNFTLGFGARQNAIATAFAKPSYVNVFLGRLNSYVADNELGDGKMVGEKALLASQRIVSEIAESNQQPTKQIAASMRQADQIASLAGVDVFTMPTKVADAATKELDGHWQSALKNEYTVQLHPNVNEEDVRLYTAWNISEEIHKLAASLDRDAPDDPDEIVELAHDYGVGDLFPRLSDSDLARIASDGKIPKHEVWAERIRSGELAVDTLLNLAGLASFAADQKALDDRIRSII